MKFQVLVEFDPETKGWSASVAGLPVFADAETEEEVIRLAKEGIQLHLEETKGRHRSPQAVRPAKARLVTVEI